MENVKVFCNSCLQLTTHNVIKEVVSYQGEDFDGYEHYETVWQIIKCAGCQTISFRESNYIPAYIESTETELIYPIRISRNEETFKKLPKKINMIYKESINCFNNGNYLLCAVGLRTLIEAICIDQKILGKNLEKKIDSLFTKNLITKNHSLILHQFRFFGNKAVHELYVPKKSELLILLEILDHTIYNIYELASKVEELRKEA